MSKSTTYTINIGADIRDFLSKLDTIKNGLNNVFNTSNLGQSLKGDFNSIEKVLTRIKNTAASPIRSDWGADTLLGDLRRSNDELDDMTKKLNEISSWERREKIKILDEASIQRFEKAKNYTVAIENQFKKIAVLNQQIASTEEKKTKEEAKQLDIAKSLKNARSTRTRAEKKMNDNAYSKEQYLNDAFGRLAGSGYATISGKNRQMKTSGVTAALGLTQGAVTGNELIDVKETLKIAEGLVAKSGDKKGQKIFDEESLNKLKKDLEYINEQKKKFLSSEGNVKAFEAADAEVKRLEADQKRVNDNIKDFENSISKMKGELSTAFNTTEFEEFKKIAESVGVEIEGLSESSSLEEFKQKIEEVSQAFENQANTSLEEARAKVEKLRLEIQRNTEETEKNIQAQRAQNERMREVEGITSRIKHFTGLYGIINLVRRSINSAIATIKDLDEEMTKMAVVTTPTISDYWKQLPQYTKRANELGAAIREVYAADTLYYQQGLKTQQVMEVSNETLKMARIASLDAAEATDRMTAAMRGFNMEINQMSAQKVNDVYSQLAAITASDVNEISVAMTKTASIAHSAGMEFETTAAFLSQIIETTRESADTAGTALKTIIARFEELKKSPLEIGEVDGEVVDANKIETALRSVGIALRDTRGQFRDLDDVFLELSGKWDSLDKNTQRYIATIAAGSRQQSRFIAMMQNHAHTTELVAKANSSAGASQKQFEKTLDSMKTKLNALKNAWDTFTMGILNSDVLKGALTFGTTFVDVLNGIGKAADSMNASLLGSVTRIALVYAGLKGIGRLLPKIVGAFSGKNSTLLGWLIGRNTSNDTARMNGFQALLNRGEMRRTQLRLGTSREYKLDENAKFSLANFGSGLRAILPTLLKVSAIIAGIVALVGTIAAIVKKIKFNSQEEQFKRDRDALDNYKTSVQDLKDKLSTINDTANSYKNLREEFDKLVVGTDEWKEKLAEVNKEVLDLLQTYPELIKYTTKDMFGAMTIDEKGFEEIIKKQEKALYNAQVNSLRQQVTVNRNAQIENRQNVIDTYRLTNSKYDSLNNLGIDTLLDYLSSDETIERLSDELGLSTDGTSSLINTLIDNKQTLEENNESINALSNSIDQLSAGSNTGVAARLGYTIDEDRVKEIKKGLDKGTTYYDNKMYQELMNSYAKMYNLGDWRSLLKQYGADGSQNSKQLAILYGLTQGITDFETSINRFKEQADRGLFGISSIERGSLEQAIAESFAKYEAQNRAEEQFKDADKTTQSILTKILKEDWSGLTKQEFAKLQENGFRYFADLYDKYGKENKDQFEKLGDVISNSGAALVDLSEAMSDTGLYNSKVTDVSHKDAMGNVIKGSDLVEKSFEEITPTVLDKYSEELSGRLNSILESFTSTSSLISSNSRANYANMLSQMYAMKGEGGASAFNALIKDAIKHINPEDINDFINAMADGFNPNDVDWIKKFKESLEMKHGEANWIDDLTTNMEVLGDAVRHVDLKTLTEQIVEFAATLKKINMGEFENKFTKEQYEKMLTQGFGAEEFVMNVSGDFSLLGGPDRYEEVLGKYFDNITDESEKAVVDAIKNSSYRGLSSAQDLTETFTYSSPHSNLIQEFSNVEELRKFIEENKSLLTRPLNGDIKELTFDQLKVYLQDLLTQRDKYEEVVSSPEYLQRQTLLAQSKSTGYLSSSQYLFKNGQFNADAAKGLYSSLLGDENVDQAKVEQLGKWIEVMEKGGKEADEIKDDFQELAAQLGAHSALSKSFDNLSKQISKAKTKMEDFDGAVDSLSEVKDIEESMAGLGINIAGLFDELDDEELMKITQGFAELTAQFAEGSEEAYLSIINMVAETSKGGLEALEELRNEDLQDWSEYATELAYILQSSGLGTIMDNRFKLWGAADLSKASNAGKGKDAEPWKNPYDWLWNITEQINKNLYQRERLERKYKLAVEDSIKSAEDLYDISKKELSNLQEQARLQSLKGQKATEEASLLLSHYKQYAKYVSMNPATGQVQVDYEELDKQHWSQEQGSAFESFVSKLTELANEIKESNKNLEDIEDEVKEIQQRGREEFMNLEKRVREALISERQREIDTLQGINDSIADQQSKLLEAMQEEINETRRIRDNTDKEQEIEKKRQRLNYLKRDTSGANGVEILNLQEEIQKEELSYGDSLIDQSLQNIQKENQKAQEQRQLQIELMQMQLTSWDETGRIWDTVHREMNDYFEGGSSLKELLESEETYQGMSAMQKELFIDELTQQGKLAELFNDGKLQKDAEATKNAVLSYADDLDRTLNGSGVLGNKILDEGNALRVTLKDFNPKESNLSSLGGMTTDVSSIRQLLEDWINGKKKKDIVIHMVKKGKTFFFDEEQENNETMDIHAVYKSGGMNTKTGPAWLDGTPAKPEAVLNAEETKAFLTLTDSATKLAKDSSNGSGGDNYYRFEINGVEIGSDYDVERMADKVKSMIVEDSRYRNVNFVEALI